MTTVMLPRLSSIIDKMIDEKLDQRLGTSQSPSPPVTSEKKAKLQEVEETFEDQQQAFQRIQPPLPPRHEQANNRWRIRAQGGSTQHLWG